MATSALRWAAMHESDFTWEREALDFLREHIPDHDPWRAWGNFEFIDDTGKVNEVDALILSPRGLLLIEIKSRPGSITGDISTWTWNSDGRLHSYDNQSCLPEGPQRRLHQCPAEIKHEKQRRFEPGCFCSASCPVKCSSHAVAGLRRRGTAR